jgi:predicted outer membrane lipoprotein
MRRVVDRRGNVFTVLEPEDLDARVSKLIRGIGVWVLGTGLAGAFGLGVYVTALQRNMADHQREIRQLDLYGSQPVRQLARDVDSLRWELREVPRRVVEELQNAKGMIR